MPKDNIERAIAQGRRARAPTARRSRRSSTRATGRSGVAVIVEALTDNRNRTAADVRHAFTKHGGTLGRAGAVAWQFERQRRRARAGRAASTRTS